MTTPYTIHEEKEPEKPVTVHEYVTVVTVDGKEHEIYLGERNPNEKNYNDSEFHDFAYTRKNERSREVLMIVNDKGNQVYFPIKHIIAVYRNRTEVKKNNLHGYNPYQF